MGEAPRASAVSAIRDQLGLDLRESTGPRAFLVIDHVERPAPNDPSPAPGSDASIQTSTMGGGK